MKKKLSLDEAQKLPLAELNREEGPAAAAAAPAENELRPKRLSDYVGQKAVTGKLKVFLEAARLRGETLDHVLLSGPPGLGKTTLAHIVAHEMGGRLHLVPGPSLEKSVDLLAILTNLQAGDVLFIDEIHRLGRAIEETLYPAMEDYEIQIVVGKDSAAQSVTVPLPRFTLVGATTQSGRLAAPFRDRFGINFNLEFYEQSEMEQILRRSSSILGVELAKDEIAAIAGRSRGTPRIANRLLARVRDVLAVNRSRGEKVSGAAAVHAALDFLDVDARGLQPLDRRYLSVLVENFRGGPAGVEALAASLSEDRMTLEETVEPYLLKEGFILRTPKGRVATDKVYRHLGLEKIAGRNADADPVLL
jgi:Holliday junction DNA helicase RuvB